MMQIAKYNRPTGSGTKASVGSTAVAGGGASASVDLGPLNMKVAALESKVSQLELQLGRVNAVLAGLDGRFLSKMGDRSDYAYALGALYTDFIKSEMYDDGVGFRISGSPTATVEDKYNVIVKDVGWSSVAFNTINQSEASYVDADTDEATAQLTAMNITIGAANTTGYLLIDCGAELTNERCFTEIAKRVRYVTKRTKGYQIITDPIREADTDGNGNFIIRFLDADSVSVSIWFDYTYAFSQYGNITSGTYRLYIRGTDPTNNQTDMFAASTKVATLNASGITVMNGNVGARITSSGVQRTTDGGTTWT